MNQEAAVKAINDAVFKPGWRIGASRFGGELCIYFEIDTVDSSYSDADGTCRKEVMLPYVRLIDVSRLDLNGIFYEILKMAAEINSHEDREFLRIRQEDGSWYAPLHPHTPEGIAAWNQFELF
jgi:hypothetical protein